MSCEPSNKILRSLAGTPGGGPLGMPLTFRAIVTELAHPTSYRRDTIGIVFQLHHLLLD